MRFLLLLLVFSFYLSSCGDTATKTETASEEATSEIKKADEEKPAMKYTLTPFSQSQQYPDAEIEKVTISKGKFDFGVKNYELGQQTPDAGQKMCANSAKGQHIHLIVDNKPYAARYTAQFDDYELEDGEHYMLAFLSRSYHESIKTENAHVAQKISVEGGSATKQSAIEAPMLFYSRPKGTYIGEANTKKVMLDFYPVNLTLGTDYSIEADINGEKHNITEWVPYYIERLPMGDNTVTLTLLDGDGNKVNAPLNPVSRTFTLKADELE